MNQNVERMTPQPTWFFQRGNEKPFPTNEKEAFELLTSTSKWRRQDIRLVGHSDGTTYYEVIRNAGKKKEDLIAKISELKSQRQKFVQTHERLIFEELLPKNDDKVMRALALIDEIDKEMLPLEEKLRNINKEVVAEAMEAEFKKAEGNIVLPRDQSGIVKHDNNPKRAAAARAFKEANRRI